MNIGDIVLYLDFQNHPTECQVVGVGPSGTYLLPLGDPSAKAFKAEDGSFFSLEGSIDA